MEIDFLIGIRVHSEDIPEDVVKLTLSGFMQNLDNKVTKLAFHEMSLLASIIAIEVTLELIPDGLDKLQLLLSDASQVRRVLARAEVKPISKVLLHEIRVLSEGDESIMISIQFIEDNLEIFPARPHLDEEGVLCEERAEIIKAYLEICPFLGIG